MHEIEILAGSSQDKPQTQGTAPPDTGPEEDTPSPDPDAPPPRVHFAYRGPTGAAETALPCVIKVMSDLGCDEPLPDLAERNFEQVTAESFDDYLRGSRPVIRLRAENRLGGEDELLPIELHITEMSDFTPAGIARHHPQMSKALEKRGLINRLLTRMDGKPEAEDFLGKLLDDAVIMQKIVAASRAQTDFDEEYLEPAEIPIAGEATLHEFLDLMRQLFKPRSDSGAIELEQGLYALCELAYQDPMANCGDVTTTINEMTARIDHVL
ncbi:MAG: type VI secretion system contractile sheath small subunit, partial [Pseudomonadota bacterium]